MAVIGAGLIGADWTAYFLARGLAVRLFDPRPDAGDGVRVHLARIWPVLRDVGLTALPVPPEPLVATSLEEACDGADFVQENGPESLAGKRILIGQIDAAVRSEVVIASSSSSLLVSDYQVGAARPERVIAAHPFNPPSLIPLVEIAGGKLTAPEAVEWALAFFRRIGKTPIHVRKEAPGYVANRMSSALYREAVDLVASGVASVADVDAAVVNGPGLRWAVMGPHMLYHLGGGAGGYAQYLHHLGPTQEVRWASLNTSPLTEAVRARLVEGVEAEAREMGGDLVERRDHGLAAILRSRSEG